MSDLFKDKPTIPFEVFKKLAYTLPPDEIAKLPPEKLPENIPIDFVEDAPIYSRAALEGLILSANSYHLQQRLAMQEKHGEDVIESLDRAKATKPGANVRVFRNKLKDLRALLEQYQSSRTQQQLDLLSKNIKHINGLLMDVRAEVTDILRSMELLDEAMQSAPEDVATFEPAIGRLRNNAEIVERLLAEYYLLRLSILNQEMQTKNHQVVELEDEARRLQKDIDLLREELERSQTLWKRALARGKSNTEGDALQQRISELVSEQKSKEVAINENDLTLWLDAIVDASLHPYTRDRVIKVLADARVALYNLLNKYCVNQEMSALQIARNPFLQIDAKQAIRFMLMSEQFILDYFAKKRNQNTAWISDIAEVKMEDLDALEKEILQELKRSSRFKKKI
ncbi:MAG: hypothetical protein LPK58_04655 [Gammaproteobacteria bacterium]|nr:hypothetical protein [Gammaproteobacteria bacterium]MDX5374955.1 hypothetical protein [Gammaproteobacteria bacterium]